MATDLTRALWRKSTRSNGSGNCVEVATNLAVAWRKSTRSSANGNCVEVADGLPGIVAVRDSKDPSGPALTTSPADWQAFTATLRTGTFDL